MIRRHFISAFTLIAFQPLQLTPYFLMPLSDTPLGLHYAIISYFHCRHYASSAILAPMPAAGCHARHYAFIAIS
jgi:hypothetical protein